MDELEYLKEMAERCKYGGFFNDRNVSKLLTIIRRLDEAGDQIKRDFAKVVCKLDYYYRKQNKQDVEREATH